MFDQFALTSEERFHEVKEESNVKYRKTKIRRDRLGASMQECGWDGISTQEHGILEKFLIHQTQVIQTKSIKGSWNSGKKTKNASKNLEGKINLHENLPF